MKGAFGAAPSPAEGRAERLARLIAAAATVWFTLAVSWGLFGRVGAGHDAVVAARAIVAENMLTWHIAAPVRQYTLEPPATDLYYADHPWGTFWSIAAFGALLGRHAYVPRLVAVMASAATPPLLYGIGRALWGPLPGALAALSYATLPITLSFGSFPGFEVPLVAACLLLTWGYLRLAKERRARWMAVSCLGVLLAVNADWESYVFLAVVLGALLAVAFFGHHGGFGQGETRLFAQWASLTALIAAGTLAGYVAYFHHVDAIPRLLAQATLRARGNGEALREVLKARSHWIDFTFTPAAIVVGKIAAPIFVVRFLVLRRFLEIFPLAMLVMAAVQYVTFRNGADIHVYWPFPFAPYYALSVGVVATCAKDLARVALLLANRSGGHADAVPGAALATAFLLPLAILPDGIEALRYGRMTGGRYDERGGLALREVDKAQALEWMGARMAGYSTAALHEGMHPNWSQEWALHRPVTVVGDLPRRPSAGGARYFVADLAFLTAVQQAQLAHSFRLEAVGPYVLVDRAAEPGPAQGYVFDTREPTALEWYFWSGVDPVRAIRADPFRTWELREHYGQTPNPAPTAPPTTLEEVRIAHNAAVSAGDAGLAERYEKELLEKIDVRVARTFKSGTRLLGELYSPGVEATLAVYFLAPGPASADYHFDVVSAVEAKRLLSLVPRDETVKALGTPFALPPRLWRTGFIYVARNEIRHRAGRERFVGFFRLPSSADSGGSPPPDPPEPSRRSYESGQESSDLRAADAVPLMVLN